MISFPCIAVNNNLYPTCNLPNDQNISIPVMVSIPPINYIAGYPQYINVANPLMMNINNPNNAVQNNFLQNNQILSLDVPCQINDNNLSAIPSISSEKIESCESNPNMISLLNLNALANNNNNCNISLSSSLNFQADTKKKISRIHFTKEEDEKIKELVKRFGSKNWSIVSAFMIGRTAKQCRDRYSNYLVPGIFQGEWSKEEDELLLKLYKENGSKWSVIQNYFPKRSSNSIKNRWYYFLRKTFNSENEKQHDFSGDRKVKEEKTMNNETELLVEGETQKQEEIMGLIENNNQNNNYADNLASNNDNQDNPFDFDIEMLSNIDENEWTMFN